MTVPGVTGSIDYSAIDDQFIFTNLGLGDDTTSVMVDALTIMSIDVSTDQDRRLDLTFSAPGERDLGFAFSEGFAAQVEFAWHHVADVVEDLPDFLAEDTLDVAFSEAESPQIQILDIDEDTQIQMARGQLTLWAQIMAEDVIIEEGECFLGAECEGDDCDDEDEHELFGGIDGGECE
jgi:hypothetical protein